MSYSSIVRNSVRRLTPVFALLALAQPVMAQQPARLPGVANGVFQWVIVLLIAVLFGAVVFMNPKRTHQD